MKQKLGIKQQLGLMAIGALIAAGTTAPHAEAFPVVGGNGLTPNAWALLQYVQNNYPGVQSVGGVRADALPDHPSGHALDLMVYGNTGLGWSIYNDICINNKSAHSVKYCLFMVPQHHDHVHVTVY